MKLGLRELILVTLMIALLAASWWFGFKKVADRREQFREDVAAMRRDRATLREATAHVEDLGRQVEDLRQAVEFFDGKLPREKDVEQILRDVWKAAERNRLEIRRFETLSVRRDSHYSEQPIKMELAGDFEGFYAYLLELESLKRITRVTQMDLSRLEERNGAMEADIVLAIFFEPTAIGPQASAN
jgi:type IV pilus assembly protein PilO